MLESEKTVDRSSGAASQFIGEEDGEETLLKLVTKWNYNSNLQIVGLFMVARVSLVAFSLGIFQVVLGAFGVQER